ncbi:MAG TPA: hypothetical protein VGE21_06530 [Flavobacteriales bacterium]
MRKLLFVLMIGAAEMLNAQTWVQKASCPAEGRYWAAATGNSTHGYAGTGILSFEQFTSQQQDVYEYDPLTDSWTALPPYPGGVREGMAAFSIGERIFFGFGTPFIQGSNLLYEYLPGTGQWEQRASCPMATSHQKGFVIGDHFYIGPMDLGGEFYRYTASTDSWSMIAAFPGIYRNQQMVFSAGGMGYLGGGGSGFGTTEEWYRYDPVADSWEPSGSLFPNSDQSSATTINGIGYVYNVGGNGNDVYRYSAALDSWEWHGSYGDIRTPNGCFFTIGDKGYHVFGQETQGAQNVSVSKLWEFTPGSSTAVAEASAQSVVDLRYAGDGSVWLKGRAPLTHADVLDIVDAQGRLLYSRSFAVGAVVDVQLRSAALGAGLRVATLRGSGWSVKVVLE